MKKVFDVLGKNNVVGFATTDEEGNPQARAFEVAAIEDNKIYFFTASGKKVYRQMQNNPNVAFTVTTKDFVSVRVSGRVTLVDDLESKQRYLDMKPGIKDIYKSADNPVLRLFYIAEGEAEIFDLSQLPPKIEKFTF